MENEDSVCRMQRFIEWLNRRGVELDGVKPIYFEGCGWGLAATRSFQPGAVILHVPDSLLITTETVMKSKVGAFFKKNPGLFKPFEALAIWLCCEFLQKEQSEWFSYIQILPQTVSNPVVYDNFPEECLPPATLPLFTAQKLDFARFFSKITAVTAELLGINRSWLEILENEKSNYSFPDLICWAWCMVNTRCIFKPGLMFDCFDDSDGDSLALVPVIDLLNHSFDVKVEAGYSRTRNCFELTCHRMVCADQEMFVCYGPHNNAKLFIEYGFVLENNANNMVHIDTDDVIRLSNLTSYTVSLQKEEILRKADFPCYLYYASEEPSWGIMAAFKVILMNEKELLKWQEIVYNTEDFAEDLALIQCLKSALSVLNAELKEKMSSVNFEEVPDKCRSMVRELWKDELDIVQQALDQLDEMEIGMCTDVSNDNTELELC